MIQQKSNYGSINYGVTQSYDFYQGKTQSYFSLPLDDQGNNKEDTYSINFNIYYNWDVNQIIPGYIENNLQEKINVIGDDIFLILIIF